MLGAAGAAIALALAVVLLFVDGLALEAVVILVAVGSDGRLLPDSPEDARLAP